MKLSEVLSADRILINPVNSNKNNLIDELIDLSVAPGEIPNREIFRKRVFEREALQSTALADGIAIPHAKVPDIKQFIVCLGICQSGVNFNSANGQPTHLIFLIAIPERRDADYLRLLSQIARIFSKSQVRQRVLNAKSSQEVIRIIQEEEQTLTAKA